MILFEKMRRARTGPLFAAAGSISLLKVIGPMLLFTVLLVPHIGLRNYVFDDTYIQLRIARSLIEYGQPYFNPGEAVNGSSSPVWTIIVALALLAGNFHLLALAVLNAAISTAGVYAFLRLLEREVQPGRAARLLMGAAYLGITLPASIGWMETPLGLLVMSLALLRYRAGKADAFVLFGLLPFIRLEFCALYPLILCDALLRRKLPASRILMASLAGAAPMIAYELWFFGTIIPHTILAKSVVYRLSYLEVFIRLLRSILPNLVLWNYLGRFSLPVSMLMLFLAILAAAVFGMNLAFAVRDLLRKRDSAVPLVLLVFGGLVATAYLLGRALSFPWYLPLYLIPLFGGQLMVIQRLRAPIMRRMDALLAAPALFLWALALIQGYAAAFQPALFSDFIPNARTRTYLWIGEQLYRKYPQARLMASEIGGLGFAFQGYILDGVGLVTPSALKYHPLRVPEQRASGLYGAVSADFIDEVDPDIIVSLDIFIPDFIRRGDASDYVLFQEPVYLAEDAARAGETLWGAEHIDVYIRRELLRQSTFP